MAATALPQPVSPATPAGASKFQPNASATAYATARITIISGVQFGPTHQAQPAGAARRSASLIDYDGQVRPAELLEFQ